MTFDDAMKVLRAHRGAKADKALGHFIKDNEIDFEVKKGQVERRGSFDSFTGSYIEKIMTLNKWNRDTMAKRLVTSNYAELKKAGFSDADALDTAMALAEKQTVHHMLDFANRLQVEQDLRWVSYFATKHRLYWKWVLGTFFRRPGITAAAYDMQKVLNDKGGIDFELFGHKFQIPAARLLWVPGAEYSENSPLLLAGVGLLKGGPQGMVDSAAGTFGNVLTRNDTVIHYGIKLGRMIAGNSPKTYGEALRGLDKRSKELLSFRINSYQNDYFEEHGHYDAESDAVKHVLWRQMAEEAWRSNMPLPIVPSHGENQGQKLLKQFMAINEPGKRREYLDKHPELQLYFGIYQDPTDYLHIRSFWRGYTAALDKRDAIRAQIYEEVETGDGFTAELRLRRKKADEGFQKVMKSLLAQDLATTKLEKVREVDGEQKGLWGQQIAVDPLVAGNAQVVLKSLFPNLEKKELTAGLPSKQVKELRLELKKLNDPDFVNTYPDPDELTARKIDILQQIEAFQGYPRDPLAKLERAYTKEHVGPYWRQTDKEYKRIKKLPRSKQETAWAEFRAFRDAQDKDVIIDGVKFPSPVRMSWASVTPQKRRERLSKLAASAWSHLTDYEKDLLGKKVPPSTSDNWKWWTQYMAEDRESMQMQRSTLEPKWGEKVARLIESNGGHGFYKEYLFSKQPLFRRVELLNPVKLSPHHSDWVRLLQDAREHRDDTSAFWRNFVDNTVKPELAKPENKSFKRELDRFGPDFLYVLNH